MTNEVRKSRSQSKQSQEQGKSGSQGTGRAVREQTGSGSQEIKQIAGSRNKMEGTAGQSDIKTLLTRYFLSCIRDLYMGTGGSADLASASEWAEG